MSEKRDAIMQQYSEILSTLRDVTDQNVKALWALQRVNGALNDLQQAHWNHTFGVKETISSAATKLMLTVHKLMQMDAHIHGFTREDMKNIQQVAA